MDKDKCQPIYRKLVIDVLTDYLKYDTGGKLDKVREFAKSTLRELTDDELMLKPNALLQTGDDIELVYENSTPVLNFKFGEMSEKIDIEIKDN